MSLQTILGIALLGGLGAVARVGLDSAVSARTRGAFPYGTLAVNLLGCLLLGGLVGAMASDDTFRLAATGLLGSFTTFSAWILESRRLAADGRRPAAAANLVLSLLFGLFLLWLGRELGAAWFSG